MCIRDSRNNSSKINTSSFVFSCFLSRINSQKSFLNLRRKPSTVAGRHFTFGFISLISIESSDSVLLSSASSEDSSSSSLLSPSLYPMISPLVLADDDDGDNSATTLRGADTFVVKSSAITCCGNLDSTFFCDTIGKIFFGIACGMVDSDLSVELSLIISSSRDFILDLW